MISKLTGSKKSKLVIGIMMDVNHFKSINDRFGHTTGDDAIRELGRLISEITTERDMAFRYAGDEFIIISTADQTQDGGRPFAKDSRIQCSFQKTVSVVTGHRVYPI